jgi:phospholipid/cholesterol/gamma-HCH transport system permease protein
MPWTTRRPRFDSSLWLDRLGLAPLALIECLRLYGSILQGKARLDLPSFAVALRQAGLSILPALTLVGIAAGAILGSQTQDILAWFDLPGLVLPAVIDGVVSQVVPILVGILVSGRAGVALAVRQATLVVTGERDALLVMGIDPIRFTLGPVLPAMLIMGCAAAVWGNLVTLGATAIWLGYTEDVPMALFLEVLTRTLSLSDCFEAVLKPMLFALLVALVATVNGLTAIRRPQDIDRAATRTMIGAVTTILLADLVWILVISG